MKADFRVCLDACVLANFAVADLLLKLAERPRQLSFGGDVIRSGDPVEQEKRVKYRDLVANAVMLRNVADLTDVLAELREDGYDFAPEQVERLSPYMTAHLKRFGQYVLDMDGKPPPFQPQSLDLVVEQE